MRNELRYKVTAYITRLNNGKQQLLVFKERNMEHLGLQVPGGTVEKDEALIDALFREVKEESGITELKNIHLLGDYEYYSERFMCNVKRYFYQMEAATVDQFTHIVQSNDEDNGWIYDYFWADMDEKLVLFSYLDTYLNKIIFAN